jgi:hypothetical protein
MPRPQAGTAQKTTGEDAIIACRFSVLDIYVYIEVKDQRGKAFPYLDWKTLAFILKAIRYKSCLVRTEKADDR